MQVNTSSKRKLDVIFRNPFFPEPLSANRSQLMSEPSGIVEGDVVWNLVQESPLDRRGTRPGGEISSKPQRMCSLAFASAAWREAVKAIGHKYSTADNEFVGEAGNLSLKDIRLKIAANFKWDVDGIVLSTSEDTTDFAPTDCSKCNLVNVCVQGPAVTKAWSGGADLQTKAGDTLYLGAVIGYTNQRDAQQLVLDPENTFIMPFTNRSMEKKTILPMTDIRNSDFSKERVSVLARVWKVGKVLDSAASKIGGVMAKKRGRAPVAVQCAVSLKMYDFTSNP
jgi:hypothetical protein